MQQIFSQEAMANGQMMADAMVSATRDMMGLTEEEVADFVNTPYQAGHTVTLIVEKLMQAVCKLLAIPSVRLKRSGEINFTRPGFRFLKNSRKELHHRVQGLERSMVPLATLEAIHPVAQMLAMVPIGIDIPRVGLVLREWVISASDFHSAKSKGPSEASALDRLYQSRMKVVHGGGLNHAPTVSPRAKNSPGPVAHSNMQRHIPPPPAQIPLPMATHTVSTPHTLPPSPVAGQTLHYEPIPQPLSPAGYIHSGVHSVPPLSPRSPVSPRSPRSPRSPHSPRSPRTPHNDSPQVNKSGGATHIGTTWARSPTGRDPPKKRRSTSQPRVKSPRVASPVRNASLSPRKEAPGAGALYNSRNDMMVSAQMLPVFPESLPPSPMPVSPIPAAPMAAAVVAVSPVEYRHVYPESPSVGLPPLAPPSPTMNQDKIMRDLTVREVELLGKLRDEAHDPGNRIMAKPALGDDGLDFSRARSLENEEHVVVDAPPLSPVRQRETPEQQSPPGPLDVGTLHTQSTYAPEVYIAASGAISPTLGAAANPVPLHDDLRTWLSVRGLEKYTEVLNGYGIVTVKQLMACDPMQLPLPKGPQVRIRAYISGQR